MGNKQWAIGKCANIQTTLNQTMFVSIFNQCNNTGGICFSENVFSVGFYGAFAEE